MTDRALRCVSWNVNGLRAAHKKGFAEWCAADAPDVLLLQEVKAREEDVPQKLVHLDGYVHRFHPAQKRGYSGIAVYARREPDEWIVGVGEDEYDCEGRMLSARFGDLVVGSVYFPNSQQEGKRLDYRLGFNDAFQRRLDGWRKAGLGVVMGGDFNVAHEPIDLARPKQNEKNPGYLPEERAWMGKFLDDGWVDTWRAQNPDLESVYSWWSYRAQSRARNVGWRLDYFCVDAATAAERVGDVEILCDVEGSDHCPVAVTVDA